MILQALRLWNDGFLAKTGSRCDRAEELLRRAVVTADPDHRTATVLASLLIRRAATVAADEWTFSSDDIDLTCEPWSGIAARLDEARNLLDAAAGQAPDDPVVALTSGTGWLERWDLYRMADISPPDDLVREGLTIGSRVVDLCPSSALASLLYAVALVAGGHPDRAGEFAARLEAQLPGGRHAHPDLPTPGVGPPTHSPGDGYSWYVVQRDFLWNNQGELSTSVLVTTDQDEVRRACDAWALGSMDTAVGLRLQVFGAGRLSREVDLGAAPPDLAGPPLPFGMPVLVPLAGAAAIAHYGYTSA